MAVWVDCQGGPNWFGGFAADMGEYIGPWPMMPTAVTTGLDPATSDEIDFVLGFDNPAHPGDPYYALDGTYDSPIWIAERFMDAFAPIGSRLGWRLRAAGGAVVPEPTDIPPAGVHLWVVGYVGSPNVEPSLPPEAYLPTGYTTAGAAATQTLPGRWSGWQTPIAVTSSVGHSASVGWWDSESASVPNDGGNITSLGQAAIDASIAGADWSGATGPATSWFQIDGVKTAPDPLLAFPGLTQAAIGPGGSAPGQLVYGIEAALFNPDPTSGMVPDVDFGEEPWIGLTYEFDTDAPSFDAWDDLTGTTETEYQSPAGSGVGVDVESAWRIESLTTPPPPTTTGAVTGAAVANIPVGGPGTPTGSSVATAFSPIPLPSINPLYLVLTPAFLFDGADASSFPDIAADGSYTLFSQFDIVTLHGYSATTGQWRYWLPNTIGPAGVAWRTVGGHFRTAGGATMRILTPGRGWVPVLDGSAF